MKKPTKELTSLRISAQAIGWRIKNMRKEHDWDDVGTLLGFKGDAMEIRHYAKNLLNDAESLEKKIFARSAGNKKP